MPVRFECSRCGDTKPVRGGDDELPYLQLKAMFVQRQCRSCGHTSEGLDTPDACECGAPNRKFSTTERIKSDMVTIEMCSECVVESISEIADLYDDDESRKSKGLIDGLKQSLDA